MKWYNIPSHMMEEIGLDIDAFSAWDGFSEIFEDVSSMAEKNWMIEFPMQIHDQTRQ